MNNSLPEMFTVSSKVIPRNMDSKLNRKVPISHKDSHPVKVKVQPNVK